MRAQMLWRLNRLERDSHVCRIQNLALAEALGGDTSVVNPSRVMRLGGSIAWPVKEGRVIERTDFLTFDDGRPKAYLPEQIAKAFPPAQAPLRPGRAAPVDVSAEAAETPRPSHASLQIGSSQVSVEACLRGCVPAITGTTTSSASRGTGSPAAGPTRKSSPRRKR
jgi:hypothetical protein